MWRANQCLAIDTESGIANSSERKGSEFQFYSLTSTTPYKIWCIFVDREFSVNWDEQALAQPPLANYPSHRLPRRAFRTSIREYHDKASCTWVFVKMLPRINAQRKGRYQLFRTSITPWTETFIHSETTQADGSTNRNSPTNDGVQGWHLLPSSQSCGPLSLTSNSAKGVKISMPGNSCRDLLTSRGQTRRACLTAYS